MVLQIQTQNAVVVEALIAKGAVVTARDSEGSTLLHNAVSPARRRMPDGWIRVESRSHPGELVYENKVTGERQARLPTAAATSVSLCVINADGVSFTAVCFRVSMACCRSYAMVREPDLHLTCALFELRCSKITHGFFEIANKISSPDIWVSLYVLVALCRVCQKAGERSSPAHTLESSCTKTKLPASARHGSLLRRVRLLSFAAMPLATAQPACLSAAEPSLTFGSLVTVCRRRSTGQRKEGRNAFGQRKEGRNAFR